MSEIDLIPADFHNQRQSRHLLLRFVIMLAGLGGLLLAVTVGFNWKASAIETRLELLQARNREDMEQRRQLDELNSRKESLAQQLQLLHGLRSGVPARQLFLMMDRVLPEEGLWLTQWKFSRAGTRVDAPPATLGQGYFIVIPRDGRNRENKPQTWRIESEMTLSGQARDYAALSGFVLRLTEQPEVSRVRMLENQRVDGTNGNVVNFRIGVTLSGREVGKDT